MEGRGLIDLIFQQFLTCFRKQPFCFGLKQSLLVGFENELLGFRFAVWGRNFRSVVAFT